MGGLVQSVGHGIGSIVGGTTDSIANSIDSIVDQGQQRQAAGVWAPMKARLRVHESAEASPYSAAFRSKKLCEAPG